MPLFGLLLLIRIYCITNTRNFVLQHKIAIILVFFALLIKLCILKRFVNAVVIFGQVTAILAKAEKVIMKDMSMSYFRFLKHLILFFSQQFPFCDPSKNGQNIRTEITLIKVVILEGMMSCLLEEIMFYSSTDVLLYNKISYK